MMFSRIRGAKTLSAICLVLMLGALLLAGCGQSSAPPKQETGDKPAAPEQKQASQEKPAAKTYPAKEITYIVPGSAGGSFDTFSRILTPYMSKYIPGNPIMIVKNVTGGGWLKGVNEIMRAKPDGSTMGIFTNGNVMLQLTGSEFDLTKATWIGKLTDLQYVGALSSKSKLKSFEDMKKAGKVNAGIVSLNATDGVGALITLTAAKVKANFITHKGSSEAVLSGVRGDVDYVQLPFRVVDKFVPTGDLVPVVAFSPERMKAYPDTPTIKELGYGELLDLVKLGFLVGAPPDMPADVIQMLRDAFEKAVNDPECIDKLQKAGSNPVISGNHETALADMKGALTIFGQYKDLIVENQK